MTTNTKPKEDNRGRRLLNLLREVGMFTHRDACTLPAVAKYIQRPGQTIQEAYKVVVNAILSNDLHHTMVGSTYPRAELPVTRWTWVDDWVLENASK